MGYPLTTTTYTLQPRRLPLICTTTPVDCCLGFSPERRPFPQYILFIILKLLVLLLLFVYFGAVHQRNATANAPSTLEFYQTSKVCAMPYSSSFSSPSTKTFEQSIMAPTNNRTILHCGECGKCSNPNDIQIYHDTKDTLTDDTKFCASKSLFWGRKTARKCMVRKVNFTSDCMDCWIENIMCDLRNCLFVCMWNQMFSRVHPVSWDGKEILNPCTECDEKRCGKEFIRCAGANRRRSGIVSDIFRDDEKEVCTKVDVGWLEKDGSKAKMKKSVEDIP